MARKYAPNQIRTVRKANGITMQDVVDRLGLHGLETTEATVHKLETSQMGLTLDYINAFAKALGVPPEALVASEGAISTRRIPIMGAIAAGNWREAVEHCDSTVVVPAEVGGLRSFALQPDGDSMDKLVEDDSGYIVVDPDQIELIDRKCYAIRNEDGEATFKRFMASPPRLEPCSTNPMHKPIPLGMEPFTIIGRVTFVGRHI